MRHGGDGENEGRVAEGPREEEEHAGGVFGFGREEGSVRGFEVVDADGGDGVVGRGSGGEEGGCGVSFEGGHVLERSRGRGFLAGNGGSELLLLLLR